MKKFLVMLAMSCIVVLLVACSGSGLDAVELMHRSVEAQDSLDINSMRMEIEIDINILVDGTMIEMPMTMIVEMESPERLRMENITIMAPDTQLYEATFIRDGYAYHEGNENRTYWEADNSDFNLFGFDENLIPIEEGWIEDSSAEELDIGYRLTFMLNSEGAVGFLGDMDVAGLGELFGRDESAIGTSEMSMIVYLDEDYLPTSVAVELEIELSIEDAGMPREMDFSKVLTLSIEDVVIDFPDWLDEIGDESFADEMIGTWELATHDWIYTFNADGTAFAGILENPTEHAFYWEIRNGDQLYVDFGAGLGHYAIINNINVDMMRLSYVDDNYEFIYIRDED